MMSKRKTRPLERPPRTLSVCLIVKNEEHNLAACLKSVQGFADEIIAVDTGSADHTVAIAESAGAKVVQADWRNDFSHARNLSLDQASCTWILWLDADDRVPPGEIEKFKRLKSAPPDRAFLMRIRNVRRGGFGEQWFQLRMFPNHPAIRFERRIHEQIVPSLIRLKIPTKQVEVRIDHLGYENPQRQKDKARRNLEILFADLADHREDPLHLAAIANSYFVIEEFAEALKWYKEILEIPNGRRKHDELFRQTPTSIALCLKNLGDPRQAWEWIEIALRDNPQKIDSLFIGAEIKEKAGDTAGAADLYRQVLQSSLQGFSCPMDPETMKAKSLLSLGRIHTRAAKWDEGEKAYRECAAKYPTVSIAFRELGELLSQRERFQEAAVIFKRSLELRPDDRKSYAGLAKSLIGAGRVGEAAEVLEAAKKYFAPALKAVESKFILERA